ncbi:F-box domain-containing protein [Artemisia annua]|uniref:F-box domain-containing protein n=1 Tax=Artemisia annua TaxID=35608 RepID=A0A2U1QDL5_ARTAN|nr:F-box domain-containing protein [Artemisia annua]
MGFVQKPILPSGYLESLKKSNKIPRRLNVSIHRRETLESSGNTCLTGNPIDDCWRCDPNWANNRQRLADCAIGFGKLAGGGKGGKIYVLGDPENKAVSNASYHLTNLLSEHPNMKVVVINEVDNFLFRPHLVLRAKYHARFPVLSLVRFRSVSKQWKSLIDSPEFINSYHICHTQPQHHLLVRYKLGPDQKYVWIADDDTFPQHKFSLTVPRSVNLLEQAEVLCSSHGLICFFGYRNELGFKKRSRAVIWNPSVRKCVDVIVPKVLYSPYGYTVVGFGVCPNTGDSKLVKVNNFRAQWSEDTDRYYNRWEVEVFTLSSRVWKRRDECLALLEYYKEDEIAVCGIWMMKDGVTRSFAKMFTVKVPGKTDRVSEFRKNGEGIRETEDGTKGSSRLEVYEPCSQHINDIGISGNSSSFAVTSYVETLLLFDRSDSVIRVAR